MTTEPLSDPNEPLAKPTVDKFLKGESDGASSASQAAFVDAPLDVDPRDVGTCRSCGAAIWWRVNPSGARQPFDYDPNHRKGTLMPHHATCPQGRAWQKGRRP